MRWLVREQNTRIIQQLTEHKIKKEANNMPNRDGTGPDGEGSNTGRGRGNCSGFPAGQGRGLGRGLGQGFGRGRI